MPGAKRRPVGEGQLKVELSQDERHGLIEAIDHGHDDQTEYLRSGNPQADYGEEWPETARERARRWRLCASACRKLGRYTGDEAVGEFDSMASACESLANDLESSANEYRNEEVGN